MGLAVLALAAALRLWQSDLTPFLDDEASLLVRGAQLLDTGRIPLAGGTFSIGVREPPLMDFLLAPMLLISRSPAWITACFAFCDALAALFVYLTGRQLAGTFAGVAAGLLYAVAPAAVYFTRRTDYYALTPVLVALTMFCLVYAWQRRSAAALAIGLVATAVALQLHPISAVLLPVWLIVACLLAPRLRSYRPLVPAAVLVGLTLAPYIYLQFLEGWSDVANLARFLREPKQQDWSAPSQALTLLGGGIYQQLLAIRSLPVEPLVVDLAGWLLVALAGVGALVSAARRGPWLIPAALALLPLLAGLRHSAVVLPYYMLPVLAPAAVLIGGALALVPLRTVAVGLLAVPLIWQLAGYVRFQSAVAASGPSLHYGMPLRYEMQAAALIPTLPRGSRVYALQEGHQTASFPYLTGFRYQFSDADSRYGLPLGDGGTYVVQAGGPPYEFLASHFGPPSVVPMASGQPAFGLFSVPTEAAARVDAELTPMQADIGVVQLRGYAAPTLAANDPSPAILEWRIVRPVPAQPSEVQQFAHLVDGTAVTWSTNEDVRAYPRRYWQPGDTILTWFTLNPKAGTPTGGYWLETGFYGFGDVQPLGPTVRIGPLRLEGMNQSAAPPKAIFGAGELALLGFERRGQDIVLDWKALATPKANYTVFVHLLDGAGRVVAQNDSPPQSGAYPTSMWQPGDVVSDVHPLEGAAAAAVRLEIGLYTQPDLKRLAVTRADSPPVGDHLELPL